ncbi:MAG: response regulator transcription factor [Nitrospira sp.]|nr:response regulator transcription factor [Nitrospira sp.]
MNVLIYLSSQFIADALHSFLQTNCSYNVCKQLEEKTDIEFMPDIILTDIHSISQKLRDMYPDAKIALVDTGLPQESIIAAVVTYRLSCVISTITDINLFKKALKVVLGGQLWIDNSIMKAILHDSGQLSGNSGKVTGVTARESEVISCVSKGYRNREIASSLCMSEQTVKAHLNRIFKKFNISSRSQLTALALSSHLN